jgi:uncharacterized membrane protein YcgQ (UPF0703/DUF1980 family)
MQEFTNKLWTRPVEVNIFESNIKDQLDERQDEVEAYYLRYEALSEVYTTIRKKIAAANMKAGISDLLADLAEAERLARLAFGLGSLSTTPRKSMSQIDALVEGHRERSKLAGTNIQQNIRFEFLEQRVLDEKDEDYKRHERRVAELHDQIEELNHKTSITLSDEDVAVLSDENIL